MTFTFTNAIGTPIVKSPLNSLIGSLLPGYQQGIKTRYMPRMMEADIFHKQISPLAMLASSPFFSLMNPEQQAQIGNYISQMLQNNGINRATGNQSFSSSGGFPKTGITGSPTMGGQQNSTNPLSENRIPGVGDAVDQDGNIISQNQSSLAPTNMREGVLQPFTESKFNSGKLHTDAQGNAISTPTASQVERQQGLLGGSSKIDNIFNEYVKLGKEIANAGAITQDLSSLAGAAGKLPGILNKPGKWIERQLGGHELAEKAAKFEDLQSKLKSALKETNLTDSEIRNIIGIRGGESGESFVKRQIETANYLNKLSKKGKKILNEGYNVSSNEPTIKINSLSEKVSHKLGKKTEEQQELDNLAEYFKTTPEKIMAAQQAKIPNTANALRKWLKDNP